MGRAIGSNLKAANAFEAVLGQSTLLAWTRMPIVSTTIGEERPLLASDLLGYGREVQDPTYDVANDVGDVVVPVDVRNFGRWLKLAMGAPTSTGAPAASSDVLTFTGQPADTETVTIGGKVYTFQAALTNVAGNVKIGANLAASITNLTNAIMGAGGVPGTDYAAASKPHPSVSAVAAATTLTVSALVKGPAGNAIAALETVANATWATATLAGGAVATHVFTSGAAALPSMSIEIGHPEIPTYAVHYGAKLNQLKISLARSGLLNATCSLIAIGEADPNGASVAGAPTTLSVTRFAQATGAIIKDGVQLGSVVGADFTFSNNLDTVETIKADGRIEDSDPGMVMMSGSINVRFADTALLAQAIGQTPCSLSFGWQFGDFSLVFTVHRVFLPRAKRQISGPKGVMAEFNWQASGSDAASVVVTLVNDQAGY